MKLVIFSFIALASLSSYGLSIDDAAAAAKVAGFEDKPFPKAGDSYLTTKTKSKTNYTNFKTYARGKKSTDIEQISVTCNQCDSKKISEANSILCYEDVQAIAKSLKIDFPGGVIRAFENVKSQQQSWPVVDKRVKNVRYTKTQVACKGGAKDEGIRFDFFFK